MSTTTRSGYKPKLACEISADRVLAGRISDSGGNEDQTDVSGAALSNRSWEKIPIKMNLFLTDWR